MSIWSLTFQMCQFIPSPFNVMSKWFMLLSYGWEILTWLTAQIRNYSNATYVAMWTAMCPKLIKKKKKPIHV